MCIAIYSPGDQDAISQESFNQSAKSNADGSGLVYIGDDGRFRVMKSLECNDVLYSEYLKANAAERDCLLHFRKATHGAIRVDNCHPFELGEHEMYIHNGVLSLHEMPDDEVDSRLFADRILRHLPTGWRELPDIVQMVEKFIGGSKIVILRDDGDVTILNERSGHWKDGVWYSNSSYRVYKQKQTSFRGWGDDGWPSYDHWGTHNDAVAKGNDKEPLEVVYDTSFRSPMKDDDRYEQRRYGLYVLKTSDYLKGELYKGYGSPKDDIEEATYECYDSYDDWYMDNVPVKATGTDIVHVPSDDLTSPLVSANDPLEMHYPYGFEYQGYYLCTHCVTESVVLDPVAIPLFFDDDSGYFHCEACNTLITIHAGRVKLCTFDKETNLPASREELEALQVEAWATALGEYNA